MTLAGARVSLEFRSDLATGKTYVSSPLRLWRSRSPSGNSPPSGGAGPLRQERSDEQRPRDRLRAAVAQQPRPAGGQRLLHVHVCTLQVAPLLENLGVHPV